MLQPLVARSNSRLLAVDDAKGSLGDVALRMVRLGIDVLHASEVDEAELLARQEGKDVRGVLLPSNSNVRVLEEVLEAVAPHTGIGPEAIAVVGERPDEACLDGLRDRGVRYGLFSPIEDRDLRFIGWVLAWDGSDDDLRIDPRTPAALPVEVTRRGETRSMRVADLSASGAYLETDSPHPAGSRISLEIALPSGVIELDATVRWVASQRRGPVNARPGFGVEFLAPSRKVRLQLREQLDAETARFRL